MKPVGEFQHLKNVYRSLRKSEGFKELERWVEQSTVDRRKSASKSQDTAYGELRFADGMDHVIAHVKTMSES